MGMYYSTYNVYGVHVPQDQWVEGWAPHEGERLSPIIKELGIGNKSIRVSWLSAGDYDRDMLFICMDITGMESQVEMGEYRLNPTIPDMGNWDIALRTVAEAAGYQDLGPCGWITVPDCS